MLLLSLQSTTSLVLDEVLRKFRMLHVASSSVIFRLSNHICLGFYFLEVSGWQVPELVSFFVHGCYVHRFFHNYGSVNQAYWNSDTHPSPTEWSICFMICFFPSCSERWLMIVASGFHVR